MPTFDADALRALHDVQEPRIRTDRHPKSAVVIWVVVEGGDVFVRSWLGARGRWYKDLAEGSAATLEFAGHRLPVKAFPAQDARSDDVGDIQFDRMTEEDLLRGLEGLVPPAETEDEGD